MSTVIETQIREHEERLRVAMLASDVNALDELLAPELLFTNHLGQVMTKEDDLKAHKSGIIKMEELRPSEERVLIRGDIAAVSVRVFISGSFAGVTSAGNFRFTRIWAPAEKGSWRVIVGHSSVAAL